MLWWGRSEQEIRTGGDAGARERQRRLDTEKKGGGDTVCGQGDRRAWVPGDGDCRESKDWELQRWGCRGEETEAWRSAVRVRPRASRGKGSRTRT